MKIAALMVSCSERAACREQTLADLVTTDWDGPVEVVLDDGAEKRPLDRITATWARALASAGEVDADLAWLMEDDIAFNAHIAMNIRRWPCVRAIRRMYAFFGSLYNPWLSSLYTNARDNYLIMDPQTCWGAQSLLVTPAMARYLVRHWSDYTFEPDLRMPRLASRCVPVYYHLPSLVQHRGDRSTWGGRSHQAADFDRDWQGNPAGGDWLTAGAG